MLLAKILETHALMKSRYASIERLSRRISGALQTLKTTRAPLTTSIIGAILLAIVPQMREIYRTLGEDPIGNASYLLVALIALGAACLGLCAIAGRLLEEPYPLRRQGRPGRFVPTLCASIIPMGFVWGLVGAASEATLGTVPPEKLSSIPELNEILAHLVRSRTVLFTAASLVTVAVVLMMFVGRCNAAFRNWASHFTIRHGLIVGLVTFAALQIFPLHFALLLGPLAIIFIALLGAAAVWSSLTRAGDRLRFPLVTVVLVAAAAMSLTNLTDNHRVKLAASKVSGLASAKASFEAWYESRADRTFYEKQGVPYPVVVVAASGGGLYAAHHAATVLSRIQDRCPGFAQHVFAISGVSGGSLGGALFGSLAKAYARNEEHRSCATVSDDARAPTFQAASAEFLRTDFLSPLVGSAVFSDALQRFVPFALSPIDRARAFEDALAFAWTRLPANEKGNPWEAPFLDQWAPDGAAPALLLNATNVEHGFRVVFTPFNIIDMQELGNIVPVSNLSEFHSSVQRTSEGRRPKTVLDLELRSAVALSASFPWVLPAGRIDLAEKSLRLVDGGYFENSGVETITDLLDALRGYFETSPDEGERKRPLVRFHVLIVSNMQFLQKPRLGGLSELLSPIRAMLATREQRAVVAINRMWTRVEQCERYTECSKRLTGGGTFLNLFDFDLPLGWILAPSTKRIVELHSGRATRSGTSLGRNPDDADKFERLGSYVSGADGAACEIEEILMGRQPSSPVRCHP